MIKDFRGNTPIHTASSHGSFDVLEFFLNNCTKKFIEFQNDLSWTPLESVRHKIKVLELSEAEIDIETGKSDFLNYLKKCESLLESHEDWLNEEKW